MAAVFDGPMAAVDFEQALGRGLLRRAASDPIGQLLGSFAGFFVDGDAFDGEGLADVREVEITVEFSGGPDLPSFNAAMIGRVVGDKARLFAIVEEQHEIIEERGLIGFDGEVIVSFAGIDQVIGDFTLGEQGIGGKVFATQIELVEERDGHADLVGLF